MLTLAVAAGPSTHLHTVACLLVILLAIKLEQNVADIAEIRGEIVDANFGQQIRNYVFDPYKLVKDVRTAHETSSVEAAPRLTRCRTTGTRCPRRRCPARG